MRMILAGLAASFILAGAAAAQPASLPAAIFTDPPTDTAHPPRMEVLHIPSGGVEINGVAYLAGGAGAHPTVVLLHGLPGNEKNLDLAQAIRRAGWNCITFNYRGSWGSPGKFSFAGNLDDAKAVLAYVRAPGHAAFLGVDTRKLVMAGHSMGGWVTSLTAAQDDGLAGAILISAADMGSLGMAPRPVIVKEMADDMESLAGVTAQSMADEVQAIGPRTAWTPAVAKGLSAKPVLILTSDDGLAPNAEKLAAAIRTDGGKVALHHEATDHSWSGKRIALEAQVIAWLQALK
ncbi:alpha/beta hydrolase [Phenylobacterium sp.]|uniref:alpha/beta hydrolase family protein n=1 Tax=Phenylobacterium sp. TaxID=1871053 RepID=UPI0025D2510B|nr:alpha/beta hydrolase [Phenylobacterium sp.]